MPRPTTAPDWATNDNFVSGPIIGQPTKAVPTSGEVQEGFDPSAYLKVEKMNWLLNNHAQWLDYADMRTWDEQAQIPGLPLTTLGALTVVPEYGALSYYLSGAGSQITDDIYNGAAVIGLTAGGALNRRAVLGSTRSMYRGTNDAVHHWIMEQTISITDITKGFYLFGLTTDLTSAFTPTQFGGLQYDSGWFLKTAGANTAVPGSTPTSGILQKWRIEYFGASTPRGIALGGAAVDVYLNDGAAPALTVQDNFSLGSAHAFIMAHSPDVNGAGCQFNGWRIRYNELH